MYRIIIIDDEKSGREIISNLLLRRNNILIVAEADSVKMGAELIRLLKPDIVFLDIKLHDGTAFELLKKLAPIDFEIIFITASEEYSILASRFNPIDYLLKPVTFENISEAVKKAEKKFINEKNSSKLIAPLCIY